MKRSILVLTILAALGTVQASPGDDGCVGNCGGDNGNSGGQPIDIANTNRNNNSNLNVAGALAGAHSRANSNANSHSKSIGVGIGVGGNARSNALATGGNARSTVHNVTKGGNAHQGQFQGQSNNQKQKTDQANSQSTSVNYNEADSMRYSGSYEVKTVGIARAPDIQATAGCRKPLSAGGGWMGGAFSFGTTFLDETCVRGELIRFGLTSSNPKTQQMTNDLLQYDLAKELEIARKAEAKETEKNVNAYQTPSASDSGVWAFQTQGG